MAAPKKANWQPGAAARRRIGQETKARELREAGWLVLPPEALPSGRNTVTYTKTDQGVVPELP